MLEPAGDLGFEHKAIAAVVVARELFLDELECDLTTQFLVATTNTSPRPPLASGRMTRKRSDRAVGTSEAARSDDSSIASERSKSSSSAGHSCTLGSETFRVLGAGDSGDNSLSPAVSKAERITPGWPAKSRPVFAQIRAIAVWDPMTRIQHQELAKQLRAVRFEPIVFDTGPWFALPVGLKVIANRLDFPDVGKEAFCFRPVHAHGDTSFDHTRRSARSTTGRRHDASGRPSRPEIVALLPIQVVVPALVPGTGPVGDLLPGVAGGDEGGLGRS